jgi:hypothetical protein
MTPGDEVGFATGGRFLGATLAAGALWAAWGLVRHPSFQPAHVLRVAAPLAALVLGAGFMRLVARARSSIDGEREFDRGGKALFMGFAMVAATIVAWLLLSQAIPATLTALAGAPRSEPGIVSQRVPETTDTDCRFRLVVASAAAEAGAVPHPLDECVDQAVWARAVEGGPVTLRLVGSVLGAELVGIASR